MPPQLSADEADMHALVGPTTFQRAHDYARAGAVLDISWNDAERVAYGRVHGSSPKPYTTVASITRADDGSVVAFRGVCSCPVSADCKHSVALLIAALPLRESAPPAPAPGPAVAEPEDWTAPWERTLALLLESSTARAARPAARPAPVGLQFDVVAGPGGRPAGITLRPVLPGRTGSWIRTGISWSTFHTLRYRTGANEAVYQVLTEILTLSNAAQPVRSYGHREPTVELDSFASRRIWELLAEAERAGIPLVQGGRPGAPVAIHAAPVDVSLDVSRAGDLLEVAPRLALVDDALPIAQCLLLGESAHGVAWWSEGADTGDGPTLNLAALSAVAGLDVRELLRTGSISIPAPDNERFLREFYPPLRRVVPVTSADGSVVLPQPAPPVLSLTVDHRAGHELALEWDWIYAIGAAGTREPIDTAAGGVAARDPVAEQEIVGRVLPLLLAQRGLATGLTRGGGDDEVRIADRALLCGMDAVRFATETVPALGSLTGVQLEITGTPTQYRAADAAPVIEFAGTSDSDDRDWFNLEVTVSIEGEQVPFRDLFVALAEGREHLILSSGTYFGLDTPELQRLVALIAESRDLLDAPAGNVRLGRYHVSMWDDLERIGRLDAESAGWQQTVRGLASAAGVEPTPAPARLLAELRPYQQAGFDWLVFLYEHGLGGVLADEMGLGKTVQALALFCHVHSSGASPHPFLVVAPTSVVHNWAAETHRFAPHLRVATVTETQRRRRHSLADAIRDADVVITSYTLFRLEHAGYAAQTWAGLVLDEAQFVKNHRAAGYRCARELRAPFKLAITGTPMENNLMELWALLSITAPGLFPEPGRFEHFYRRPIERDRDPAKLTQLRRRIRPVLLRRTKREVLADLPDKQEQVIELDLNSRHRTVYERYLQRERQKVLGLLDDLDRNRFEIFRSLTLLRQASLDVSLVDPEQTPVPSTKLDALLDQVDEIVAEGHRVVVFSQFTRFLDLARRRLDEAGIDYRYLDGKTRRRGDVLADFKQGTAPVFLISLKAGGFGLNLTEADYCIVLDPWWNPATEAQAVDRLHRIGQTRKVMVYRLVARDTIEEKVMALRDSKAALFRSVIDSGDFSSAALTADEIRALVA